MKAELDPRITAHELVAAMRSIGCRVVATRDGSVAVVKNAPPPAAPAKPRTH